MTNSKLANPPTAEKLDGLLTRLRVVSAEKIAEAFAQAEHSGPFMGRQVACKAGCAYCCHQIVVCTAIEVFGLARWMRENKTEDELSQIRKALSGFAERIESISKEGLDSTRIACPLLQSNQCSVYEARPLVCRSYHSFDVSSCERSMTGDANALRLGVELLPSAIATMDALRLGVIQALGDRGGRIRMAPALLLALDDASLETRWLAGENVFAHLQ